MKALNNVPIAGEHETSVPQNEQLNSKFGKLREQVINVLISFINSVISGTNKPLLLQSFRGEQFLQINPTVRIKQQWNVAVGIPIIEVDFGLTSDEDANLNPGIEYSTKYRRIIQRLTVKQPVTFTLRAGSENELDLMQWFVREIVRYIHRLYRGLISSPQGNWQLGFPKKVVLADKDAEAPQDGGGSDGQIFTTTVSVDTDYEAVFLEELEKLPVDLGAVGLPTTQITQLFQGSISLGRSASYKLVLPYPENVSVYLTNPHLGRVQTNITQTMITVFAEKVGSCDLVVESPHGKSTIPVTIQL